MTFLLEHGKARLTKVTIGHTNGLSAEVKFGLNENDRVILHPPDTLADGLRVAPRDDSK
jgi:HlyD family secretion protein